MREGPERVPTQQVLPSAIIIGKIVFVLLIRAVLGASPTTIGVVSEAVILSAAIGCCVLYALFLTNKMGRFSATFTAILGMDLLLTMVLATALVIQHTLAFDITQFFVIVFQLWHITIMGFIMHRALDIKLGFGVGVGLIISIFCIILTEVATQ